MPIFQKDSFVEVIQVLSTEQGLRKCSEEVFPLIFPVICLARVSAYMESTFSFAS